MRYHYSKLYSYTPMGKLYNISLYIIDKDFRDINSFLMLGSIICRFDELIEKTKNVLSGELDRYEIVPKEKIPPITLIITKEFVYTNTYTTQQLETEDFLELINMIKEEMKLFNINNYADKYKQYVEGIKDIDFRLLSIDEEKSKEMKKKMIYKNYYTYLWLNNELSEFMIMIGGYSEDMTDEEIMDSIIHARLNAVEIPSLINTWEGLDNAGRTIRLQFDNDLTEDINSAYIIK